jgi:Flp pilus assembly protein TadG
MRARYGRRTGRSSGQALIETALIMPLFLTIVLNALNFGYFFLMALNLTSSARTGGLYSIMGSATPSQNALPPAGPASKITSVSYLTYQDLTHSVYLPTTNGSLQVCSPSVGINNPGTKNETTACSTVGAISTFNPPDPDPELNAGNTAPAFLLNRVDVTYQFQPLVPLMPFNIVVLASPACTSSNAIVTCTFTRHTEMRVMGP